MIHAKRNLTTLLVVSLFIAVISLSGAVSLAAVAPVVTAMPPVRDGMTTPVRLALDPSGNAFYVTDARAKAVLKYNVYGHLVKTISTADIPLGIAVSGVDDGLRVLVTQGKYVSVYNPESGVEDTRIGVGVIGKANGVAVGDGFIYVADGASHKVHVFDGYDFSFKTSIGSFNNTYPAVDGTFNNPSSVVYEKANRRIAVVDTNNGRIQFFNTADPNYGFVGKIGGIGKLSDARLDFASAQGVAFEYTAAGALSRMYVADTWKGGVQVIDPVNPSTGTFLSLIGAGKLNPVNSWPAGILSGTEDYQFLLPTDVQFDPVYRRLFVVSADSSIKILGIDGGKSPSDNLPLFLTINPAPLNTNVSTYAISGTVKPGSTVKVTADTGAVAGAIVYAGSTWSTTLSGLALGSNKIKVLAVDVSGNEVTRDVTIAYSLNAPALAITAVNGVPLAQLNVLSQLSAPLQGTVDAGCTVTIKNNTTQVETVATVIDSTWSGVTTLSNNVANSITVTAKKAGSNDATANVTIISDTVQPILHISALPDGSFSSGTMTQDVSGYVQDANPATVSVTVNGGTATVVPTPLPAAYFSVPVSLQVGENTIVVQATDLGGKTSWINTRKIFYDAARPQLTIDNGNPSDNTFTKTASIAISGKVTPANATVTIVNIPSNGVAVPVTVVNRVTDSWNAIVPLVAGQNTIVVTATSGASGASLKRTVTLDDTAPELAITSPATAAVDTKLPNMDITGTVSGGADGYPAITVTINSAPVASPLVTNGTFTFNTGTSLVVNQVNTISVTATDSANNSTTVTRSINYDTVIPNLIVTASVAQTPASIAGTVDASAAVTITDDSISYPVVQNGSIWSANLRAVNPNYDSSKLVIKATDPAGNSRVQYGLTFDKPTGDINNDGSVTAADALLALQFAVGPATPTPAQKKAGDIGQLYNGGANPDGTIDATDAILILRKSVDPNFSW